jgi:hypothetical protein
LSAFGNALNTSSSVLLKPVAPIIATRAKTNNFFMIQKMLFCCVNKSRFKNQDVKVAQNVTPRAKFFSEKYKKSTFG